MGFDCHARTLFTCEGIFCYLSQVLFLLCKLKCKVCSCMLLRCVSQRRVGWAEAGYLNRCMRMH